MKKRIFISIYYLHLGGAETSLIGLLNALDTEKYDVDLFVFHHVGEMMQYIPKGINLLPEEPMYAHMDGSVKQCIKDGYWKMAFKRVIAHKKFSKYAKEHGLTDSAGVYTYIAREVCPILPSLEKYGEYDIAISYIIPHQVVLEKVKAKKKICWLHTDYTKVGFDPEAELKVWNQYDHISSISSDVTKSFLKIFPSLESKIIEIENIMPTSLIRSRAEEFEVDWEKETRISTGPNFVGGGKSTLRILSIGRFSEQKNFDNLPFICSIMIEEMKKLLSIGRFCEAKNYDNVPSICQRMLQILDENENQNENSRSEGSMDSASSPTINHKPSSINLKWYIIGYGGDETLIRQKIAEAGMQDHVIILGKRTNPYPYIKGCDIYVQPSRYEGKSITVREAQMLCKPVVVTNYPTASSQIQDCVDGVIVPMDNEGCAKGLAEFILDSDKQSYILEYLKTHDFSGQQEVNKIYNLIEV